MHLTFNDQPVDYDTPPSLAQVIAEQVGSPEGIAVAVNGTVVSRSSWDEHILADGDRLDVLTAVQGG